MYLFVTFQWREVARDLVGVIRIGAVNCEDDWHLCRQKGINSYPTLILYPEVRCIPSESILLFDAWISVEFRCFSSFRGRNTMAVTRRRSFWSSHWSMCVPTWSSCGPEILLRSLKTTQIPCHGSLYFVEWIVEVDFVMYYTRIGATSMYIKLSGWEEDNLNYVIMIKVA